jgi:hypothetical protein
LTVGDEERSEGSQTLESLLAMLLGSLLVERSVDVGRVGGADLLCLPDEVLEEITVVLGEKEELGLLNDVLEVSDELLAVGGQLLVGLVEVLPFERRVQRDVDLLV